jgi:hypothetical protein
MAENKDDERITILCNQIFKQKVKRAILEKDINKFQDGYQQIFELGLKEFIKNKKEV